MTEKEAFKDWGTINSIEWSNDQKLKDDWQQARHMHFEASKNYPEKHKIVSTEIGRCYTEYKCAGCGFKYRIDSSD